MDFQTLKMIRAAPQLANVNMFYHRRIGHYAQVFYLMMVLLFSLAILATCEVQVEYDGCKPYRDNSNSDFQDVISSENLGFGSDSEPHGSGSGSLDNVCRDSNLFCFRSTLPGLLSPDNVAEPKSAEVSTVWSDATSHSRSNHMRTNISWSSNCGIIKFSSGRTISCSLKYLQGCCESGERHDSSCRDPLLDHKSMYVESNKDVRMHKSGNLDDSSPHIEISPPLLDWGQKYLYFPSLAFLTVKNTHRDNLLTIYEPYSTNSQFYPCNSSEILLEPGEAVSICFVFLPAWLGLSSAQLVLQTSSGGFLIQITGFGVESPYKIQPLLGLDVTSSVKWRKNLSLFNPFNDALYVEEVIAWISVSSGNTSHSTKAVCSINSTEDQHELSLPAVNEWIDVKSSEVGLPLVSMRPHRKWEVGPLKTETIVELDFSFPAKGKIFGAFCMQLQRSSKEKIETVVVPLEVEHGGSSDYIEQGSPISISLQALVPSDGSGTIVVNLSLKNDAPYVLRVVKINEVGENINHFCIKYIEGLILFPSTVTQVASISFPILDPSSELSGMNKNCELLVLTDDSRNAEIKVPCRDIVRVCSSHILESSVGSVQGSENVGSDDIRGKRSSSAKQPLLLNEALNSLEADELVLKNWKSHATASGMSVLDGSEVLFPVVMVGSHSSEFVMVKNPSDHPVVMQLILHSGEIIDECKAVDGPFQPPSSRSLIGYEAASPPRYGFSIAEGALTEALVHPHGRASLGPLLFQPSDRCGWRSSVLVRNNLSGVEWLSLRGIGGSFSMLLLEESELVQSLDFKLSLPAPHTFTSLDIFHHMEENIHSCFQPLSKELYAKNIGELPLEIRSIKVSGTECGLDGFAVQTCKGFVLEPGNSIMLTITYQADFSVATIHRDLELGLATGILVIPMKASLPLYMLSFCKKTIFWTRVKRSTVTILLAASILFLVLCCCLSSVMAFGQGYLFKCGKSTISTVTQAGKSSCAHQSHKRNGTLALSARMNGLLKSIGEEESLLMESVNRCNDGRAVPSEECSSLTAKPVKSAMVFGKKSGCLKDTEKGVTSSSSGMTNSVAVESSDTQEMSQAGNLKVKTGKDKGRRRRKKKSSGNGIIGLFEVSSSQSGNSTPSSPLSPVSSLTPKRPRPLSPDVNHSVLAKNPFVDVAIQQCERSSSSEPQSKGNILRSEISSEPGGKKNQPWGISTQETLDALHKMPGKPVLLPSANLQSAGRPDSLRSSPPSFQASASTIAPHARAPGSKLYEQKAVKNEGKADWEEKFRYDIWGEHMFELPLMDESKGTSRLLSHTTENNSDSFFVRGPQTLKTIAQPEPLNCSDELG